MVWVGLAAIVAAFLLAPAWRCLVKRWILAAKLKKLCRRKQYKLYKNHVFWLLGGKRGERCDFYVETHEKVYAVKLFGMRRNTMLVLHDDGSYHVRRLIAVSSIGGFVDMSVDENRRILPRVNYRYRYRVEWEIKTPRPVLLVHPVCREIRYIQDGKAKMLTPGQAFGGATVYSLGRFWDDLEVSS